MSKKTLTLNIGKISAAAKVNDATVDGHMTHTDVSGKGKKDFPFPEVGVLVARSVKRAAKKTRKPRAKKTDDSAVSGPEVGKAAPEFIGGLAKLMKINKVVPAGQTRETYSDGQLLLHAADGLQELMVQRQFDSVFDQRFARMEAALTWAKTGLAPKYNPAMTSLGNQLTKLTTSYKAALPQVIAEIAKQNPGAPVSAVVAKAIEVLDEELAQILFVLQIYTDSIEQYRDGKYTRILKLVNFFFEQGHKLFWAADLHDPKAGTPIPAGKEKVGAVYLARVTEMGLATFPGAAGPIGANAQQLSYELLDFLIITCPLLGHEGRHNVFHDVDGLEDELTQVLAKAIMDAIKAGVKLSGDTVAVGKNNLPADQFMAKIFTDWLGEIDADMVGGVLFNGPAFGDSMIISFPAMMIRDGKVSEKVNLLRTSSIYNLVPQKNGSVALQFEAHPIDYIRVYLVAAALDEIGYADAAKRMRELADFAVGETIPDVVTFRDGNKKSKVVISVSVADLKALCPTVAKTLIRTQLKSLGGKSAGELLMWTQKRQDKVDAIAKLLEAGKSDLPADIGDIYATYIGAAAVQAFMNLVRGGMDGATAAKQVSDCGFNMMEALRVKDEATA